MWRPLGSTALEEQSEISRRAFLLLSLGSRPPKGYPYRSAGRDVLSC